MKIGIIVYSQTGNTFSVSEKLKAKLSEKGHTANLERLILTADSNPEARIIHFQNLPDIGKYDNIIFAAPVQAFSLCPAMKKYLSNLGSLEGKAISLLVTQGFPAPWLGGNHAIRQMKRFCQSKGANIVDSAIVNWMRKDREQLIVSRVEQLSGNF